MQNSDRLQSTVYVDNTKYYGSSNKLIVLSNGQITEYDLAGMKKDRLFFGSSMQCDIVINDPVISEIQGKIKLVNDMVYVGDLDDETSCEGTISVGCYFLLGDFLVVGILKADFVFLTFQRIKGI